MTVPTTSVEAASGALAVRATRGRGGTSTGRLLLESALVLALVLAYLWPFRLYGFDVVDEGTQLAQIERVAEGEQPYVDFETGYTPGYFAFHAWLWRTTGRELVATRTFGVLLQAATVALGFALVRARTGALVAACAALLQVAFLLPVSLRFGAPFNAPYAGWLAAPPMLLAQALAAQLAGRRVAAEAAGPDGQGGSGEGPLALRALGAGIAAGAAFSVKPNAGLLALAGVALAAACGWGMERRSSRALALALRVAALPAAVALLWPALDPRWAAALLLPVAAAAVQARRGWRNAGVPSAAEARLGGAGPGAPAPGAGVGDAVRDLGRIAAGFLVAVASWLVPLVMRRGPAEALRDVLLLDGGVARIYLLPFPRPLPATVALLTGLGAAALLVRVGRRAAVRSRDSAVAATVVGARRVPGGAERLAPGALATGLVGSIVLAQGEGARLVAENVCLWLGPAALLIGLASLPGRRVATRERALLCFAALGALQLYPRADLMHVSMAAPPIVVAAAVTWGRLATAWRRSAEASAGERGGAPVGRVVPLVVTAIVVLLAAGRALPTLLGRLREPMVQLDAGERAPLIIAARHAAEMRWLGEAVRGVRARTGPEQPIFAFPDLAGLAFLADRPMPFFHVYFVPGRPDRTAQSAVIERLERVRPALAVVGPPLVAAFAGAQSYFDEISGYLASRYDLEARAGGCDLLRRRGPASRP